MKKKDYLLILIVLLFALLVYIFVGQRKIGDQVVIELDGKEYGSYSLRQTQEIVVESDYGTNIVKIENGMVYMKEADCPDHYCMKQGKTNSSNKSLVCLPHKLVVSVKGKQGLDIGEQSGKNEEIDAIAQ